MKSAVAVGATMALSNPNTADAAEEKKNAALPAELYPLGPDSKSQPGVPNGKVFNFSMDDSRIFPGTRRTIDVYIPVQYTAEKPACVWVAFDGLLPSLPTVFDNLIHKNEMPVTIAIGLHPGTVAASEPSQNPRFNRCFEFDSLTDRMARFISEELLPAVEKQKTPDGLPILLSGDPNDRGIAGGSSGGIAAFTAAWQNPDAFRRVFSVVGTFVGMRGGDRYPVLVRKTEPKPLRIFLQDGEKDGWPGGLELGDWWMSNLAMERSLTFAGYQVNHAWGVLGHDGRQGESIFPDVMRWLWKDWPKPVVAGQTSNFAVQAIARPSESWQIALGDSGNANNSSSEISNLSVYVSPTVIDTHATAAALACDSLGRVYVQNPSSGEIFRVGNEGNQEHFAKVSPGDNGIAFGPDGRLYIAETETARIFCCDAGGKTQILAEGIRGHRLTVAHNGNIYITESHQKSRLPDSSSGKIWLIRPGEKPAVVAEGLNGPSGISLTPDGLWLCAGESLGHHAYSYQVRSHGELKYGEPFYWLHVPDSADNSGVGQLCMDRQGWTYAATRMGVQVLDRNGRVTAIFPVADATLTGICFGDADFQTLYVSTGDAIYRRKVKTVGMSAAIAPISLPSWTAG